MKERQDNILQYLLSKLPFWAQGSAALEAQEPVPQQLNFQEDGEEYEQKHAPSLTAEQLNAYIKSLLKEEPSHNIQKILPLIRKADPYLQNINEDLLAKELWDVIFSHQLIHYVVEQRMLSEFNELADFFHPALVQSLLLHTYTREEQGAAAVAPMNLRWKTNCLIMAIENNDVLLFDSILQRINFSEHEQALDGQNKKAGISLTKKLLEIGLHFCVTLDNGPFFDKISKKLGIGLKELLSVRHAPNNLSACHLFLRDKTHIKLAFWSEFEKEENSSLAKEFLLTDPSGRHDYPLIIALKHNNILGVIHLMGLITTLSDEELTQLVKQQDDTGRNTLHYLLQFANRWYLPLWLRLLKGFRVSKETFVALLNNPGGVNTLKEYLKHSNLDNLNQLLEHSDGFDGKRINARQSILREIPEWMVTQANDEKQAPRIRALLRNFAPEVLIDLIQQYLREAQRSPERNATALKFFSGLLPRSSAEIKHEPQAAFVPLVQPAPLVTPVHERITMIDQLAASQKKTLSRPDSFKGNVEAFPQRIPPKEKEPFDTPVPYQEEEAKFDDPPPYPKEEAKFDDPPPYPKEEEKFDNPPPYPPQAQADNHRPLQMHGISFWRSKPFREHLLSNRPMMVTLQNFTKNMKGILETLLNSSGEKTKHQDALMEELIATFLFLQSKSREMADSGKTVSACSFKT